MSENRRRMLGRTPSKPDPRTLRLIDYTLPTAPPPPDKRCWQTPITDWGVMGNDRYGNCTLVTAAHMILAWRANELQDTRRITDQAVIDLADELDALNGFNILERLNIWRRRDLWSNRLWVFAAVDPSNQEEIRLAINSFGGADIGLNLPLAWKDADTWDTGTGRSYRPGSWGGHSVPIVGYDPTHVFAVTWGDIIPMTWASLATYCDEAYALLNPCWIEADATSPSGFDLAAMHADLMAVTQ